MSGYPPPPTDTPRIRLILKAIDENHPGPERKSPIDYKLLSDMLSTLSTSYDDLTWRAALTLGFFGGLRGAEYAVHNDATGVLLSLPLFVHNVDFGIKNSQKIMRIIIKK